MSDDTVPMNSEIPLQNGSVLEALSLTPSIPGSAGLSTEMSLREQGSSQKKNEGGGGRVRKNFHVTLPSKNGCYFIITVK